MVMAPAALNYKLWLTVGEVLDERGVNFSGPQSVRVPVAMFQTGGSSRTVLYPGVFTAPRVRTYADQFGTVLTSTSKREISFSLIFEGNSRDDIYRTWNLINRQLVRAIRASGPNPIGKGVVLVQQTETAQQPTLWDVVSGVLTDVDANLPGIQLWGGVCQLAIMPFARGATVGPGSFGSTITNGVNGTYFKNVPGDEQAIYELRLRGKSTGGNVITRVRIARRSHPDLTSGAFTPSYTRSDSITTSPTYQQLTSQASAAGAFQTGRFGLYGVFNDSVPIIAQPVISQPVVTPSNGAIGAGVWDAVVVSKDASGNPVAGVVAREAVVQNLLASGLGASALTLFMYDDFETQADA